MGETQQQLVEETQFSEFHKDLSLDPQTNNRQRHLPEQQHYYHHYPHRHVDGGCGGGGGGEALHNFHHPHHHHNNQAPHEINHHKNPPFAQTLTLPVPEPMRKRSSRTAPRNAGAGEIVEVQGGRIVRSTGGKDRHSKVCTAKGTRDRRVRLAAHTAIQFYDVQDRLGFDRPSRAVDWLINKAKAAIDELDELPPWNPAAAFPDCNSGKSKTLGGGDEAAEDGGEGDELYGGGSLLPPSVDSDAAIADTIKSSTPLDMQFRSYPSADLLHRRSSSQSQDLKLSLQSLQGPILTQSHHHSRGQNQEEEEEGDSRLFPESAQIGFDNLSASWAENQRLIGWNSPGGFMFIPPQAASQQPLLFGHGVGSNGLGQTATQFFSQRGPLQSSNSPPNGAQISAGNNQNYHQAIPSLSGFGFASSGGISGFPFTAQIGGGQEDHGGGDPNNPSSVSSASRH